MEQTVCCAICDCEMLLDTPSDEELTEEEAWAVLCPTCKAQKRIAICTDCGREILCDKLIDEYPPEEDGYPFLCLTCAEKQTELLAAGIKDPDCPF